MRSISLALVSATTFLVAACAPARDDGVVDPVAAEAAVSELFADNGERVLLQGMPVLNQTELDAAAAPNQNKIPVRTEQGVFMMTQMQLNQYAAIQRAAQAQASTAGYVSPYGTVVSRTVVSRPAAVQTSAINTAAPAAASSTPRRSVPGAFDPYIAPSLSLTQGPNGFKNADGTYDCVMTFDDGPHHTRDPQIYDILDQKGIKAVFFFLGEKVQKNPNTAKAAVARGHEVGYHSWDHKNLRAESLATVQEDFRKGMEVFKANGLNPRFFRPPFGNYNSGIISTAQANGMEVINWSNDSLDWKIKSANEITSRVLNRSIPGDIVLLHSIHSRSVEALPGIIDGLKAKGCRFTTLQSWASRATS